MLKRLKNKKMGNICVCNEREMTSYDDARLINESKIVTPRRKLSSMQVENLQIEDKVDKMDTHESLACSASTAVESDYNQIHSPANDDELD